jgi:murein DD-endopeptidase MepM/ murein hydrolase activator NlpD
MGLNPFNDSNLEDLQNIINTFISKNTDYIIETLQLKWKIFLKKAKERLTIMLIPHSEKKIINFHVPIYMIVSVCAAILIIVIITSVAIVNHASTIKDVSKLKIYGSNSKVQIEKYKKEINKLYNIFQELKPEVKYFYSLTNNKDSNSLWAKGGPGISDLPDTNVETNSPSLEELNIKEIEQELATTREIFVKIRKYIQERKKILEHTPSIWPANGYIISRFNSNSSSLLSESEHNYSGINIAAFPGTAIKATAPGEIEKVSWDPDFGLQIYIKHKYGFSTVYSHCERVTVKGPVDSDDKVEVNKGDIIGYVGKTGKANRHMCFYQVKIGINYVDPLPYLNKISR